MQRLKAAQGLYDVVVIDPPWPVAFQAREVRPQQVALPYATMSVEEIRALQLPLADVAHVWLWTTHRFLFEAERCFEAWGLTYSHCYVWKKPGGMQPLGRPQFNVEWLLLDSRGVEVPMASNPTWVMLSSLKPLFFNSLKINYASWTTWEQKTPESNKSDGALLTKHGLRGC